MQKTVNVEAKTSLKSTIMIWNVDSYYFRGHCPSQNTFAKIQTQVLTIKKFKPEKSRSKNSKPIDEKTSALSHTNKSKKMFY